MLDVNNCYTTGVVNGRLDLTADILFNAAWTSPRWPMKYDYEPRLGLALSRTFKLAYPLTTLPHRESIAIRPN